MPAQCLFNACSMPAQCLLNVCSMPAQCLYKRALTRFCSTNMKPKVHHEGRGQNECNYTDIKRNLRTNCIACLPQKTLSQHAFMADFFLSCVLHHEALCKKKAQADFLRQCAV